MKGFCLQVFEEAKVSRHQVYTIHHQGLFDMTRLYFPTRKGLPAMHVPVYAQLCVFFRSLQSHEEWPFLGKEVLINHQGGHADILADTFAQTTSRLVCNGVHEVFQGSRC